MAEPLKTKVFLNILKDLVRTAQETFRLHYKNQSISAA
jgi:hypothetical protein